MQTTTDLQAIAPDCSNGLYNADITPFEQEMVSITKQKYIRLTTQKNYWQAQHAKAKEKIATLEQKIHHKDGQIKDCRNRLFGKRSEKKSSSKSEKKNSANTSNRSRGQQKNSTGHGRTTRPDLPVMYEQHV